MFCRDIFLKTEDCEVESSYIQVNDILHITKVNENITHFVSKFSTKDIFIYFKHDLKTYKYHNTQLYEIQFYF